MYSLEKQYLMILFNEALDNFAYDLAIQVYHTAQNGSGNRPISITVLPLTQMIRSLID